MSVLAYYTKLKGHEGQTTAHVSQPQLTSSTPEHGRDSRATLTADQIQRLLSYLNTQNTDHDKLSGKKALATHTQDWILDSGASNHMTGQLDMMVDVKDITSVLVGLPSGMKTLSTKGGRVCMTQEVILNDVLYIPDLIYNLISIN